MTLDFATKGTLLYLLACELASTLDLEDVFGRVLRVMMEIAGAEFGFIFLLDPAGHVTRQIPARPDVNAQVFAQAAAQVTDKGLAAWAIRNGKIALASDVQADARWVHLPDAVEEIGSAMAVPLIHRVRVNGVVVLLHRQQRFFTQSHVRLAEVIARQAAIAVENARLHAEVQQERSALHNLISGLPEPTILADETGRVTFANEVAMEVLGISEVGQSLAALMPQEQVEELIAKATTTGRSQRMEIMARDGHIFDAKFAPVANLGVAICLSDITYLKQLDKMKSQWLTTTSHDLKNPLALIHGFAQLLTEETLSADGLRCVRGILSGAEKMQALVNSLLDLEQIGAGLCHGGEQSEVGPVITSVVQDLQPRAVEKEQSLTVSLPVGLPAVQTDPLRLEQVVKNLLDNAIKYTQRGGHIHVDAKSQDGGVMVRVRDDGPGIPKVARSRLFERFFRVGSRATIEQEGTGLGLSIVRAIVEDCGGKVGVESEEGQGSTFWFWLPEAKPLSETPAATPAIAGP
jgi:signal transduction histidine kinase